MKNNRAQSLIEYGLILGIVTVALLSMQPYFKRGIQSIVKVAADDFGPQGEPVRDVEITIKKNVYSGQGKLPVNSASQNSSAQTKTNLGNGVIKSETSSSYTSSADAQQTAVAADYRTRKIE